MYIRTSKQPVTLNVPAGPSPARPSPCGCSGASARLGLVTPPDRRTLVRDTRVVPYRWICALDLFFPWRGGEQRNRGTGLLISPRHVLTAGHNIRPVAGIDALRITVTPGLDGTSLLGKPKGPVGSVTVKPKDWWLPTRFTDPRTDHAWDFGLLVLPGDLPSFRSMPYGYWGDARHTPATLFTQIQPAVGLDPIVHLSGYPADKCRDKPCAPCVPRSPADYDPVRGKDAWASMQWTAAGAVRPDAPAGVILHDTDTCTGMSGSPLWQLRKQTSGAYSMVLVGVHGGTYTRPDPVTRRNETLNRAVFLGNKDVRDLLRDRMRRDGVRPLF
jgi:V8-like Glu-specific endopeptidase